MADERRAEWFRVASVRLAVAVLSMLANWPLHAELEGRVQIYSLVRKTVSRFLNAGTTWAALAVFAGWHARRWYSSLLAGVLPLEGTLLVHYGLGQALGLYEGTAWRNNAFWFILGVVFCAPLGMCGWLARRPGWLGLLARLVVPVGAISEPWITGMFFQSSTQPWPDRYSSLICGAVLLMIGSLTGLAVLRLGKSSHASGGRPVFRSDAGFTVSSR